MTDLLAQEIWQIVTLSIRVAIVAMIFTLPVATAIAYILATRRFRGWHLLNALCHLPLVMPPVITGYLLLLALSPNGLVGSVLKEIGISFAFNWWGAALAAGIMAFPLVMRPIRLAFEVQQQELLDSAKTLGANRWNAFLSVSLPLALPGLIAGGVLGFAKALGEFGATITFVSNIPGETQTMALAIYSFLQSPSGNLAAIILVVIGVVISFGAILMSEVIAARLVKK
ncbi:MAG: molybdate ABC transporter permease subunit [Rhizobiaceae bacterium]